MSSGISLSMIVKNEGKHLYDCLNSVKDVVDEIVIVDTGSTDNTLDIAKSFDAKFFTLIGMMIFLQQEIFHLVIVPGNGFFILMQMRDLIKSLL